MTTNLGTGKSVMRALSIRQPWAELILLGHKSIEARCRPTRIRERVHIYAAKGRIERIEEARIAEEYLLDVGGLPRGVLVGTIEIVGCRPLESGDDAAACFEVGDPGGDYAWLLERPERAKAFVRPERHPQPSFFNPF